MVIEDIVALLIEKAIMSPEFLFILPSQQSADAKNIAQLSDIELATRLAFVSTGKAPDEQLLSRRKRSTSR